MCLFADLIIVKLQWFLIHFGLVTYLQHLHCIIVTTRNKVTNKRGKKKKTLMALIEVYGGQRNLAFELTTVIL